jgi:hypothetical protein
VYRNSGRNLGGAELPLQRSSRAETYLSAHQLQPLIDASAKYGVIDRQFAAADIIYGSK